MITEKKSLIEALSQIEGLDIMRSSAYAAQTRKNLPCASIDYGPFTIIQASEKNGEPLYRGSPSFVIVVYVALKKDEEEQEDLVDQWLAKVLYAVAPFAHTIATERVGPAPFRGGEAYAVALQIDMYEKFITIEKPEDDNDEEEI
jgi:hypothetical protein